MVTLAHIQPPSQDPIDVYGHCWSGSDIIRHVFHVGMSFVVAVGGGGPHICSDICRTQSHAE